MKRILPAFAALALLCGCSAKSQQADYIDWYRQNAAFEPLLPMAQLDPARAENLTTLDADARLRSYYSLDDMTEHRLLLQENTPAGEWENTYELQVDFTFPADVGRESVSLARRFAPRKFVYGSISSLNPHAIGGAYDEIALQYLFNGGFERVLSQITLGDTLILQEAYADDKRLCYENSAPVLPQRAVQADWVDALRGALAGLEGVDRVEVQQALLGNTLLIALHGEVAIDPELMESARQTVAEAAKAAERPNDVEQLNNGLYPLLVLELYRGEELYYCNVYVNFGSDRGWQVVDWMNVDFSSLYGSTN